MIGIDVGGANLKIVDEAGVHIHYCPLWKESPLAEIIAEYKEAGASVRVGRQSPNISVYYTYAGSVHRVEVASTAIV